MPVRTEEGGIGIQDDSLYLAGYSDHMFVYNCFGNINFLNK